MKKIHHRINRALSIILPLFLFILISVLITGFRYIQFIDEYTQEMSGVVDNMQYNYQFQEQIDAAVTWYPRMKMDTLTGLVKNTLEKVKVDKKHETEWNDRIDGAKIRIIPEACQSSFDEEILPEYQDELDELRKNKFRKIDDTYCTYDTWSGGEFYISWDDTPEEVQTKLFSAAKEGQVLVITDNNTKTILESNDSSLVGKQSSNTNTKNSRKSIDEGDIHITQGTITNDDSQQYYLYNERQDNDYEVTYTVFTSLRHVFRESFHQVFPQLLLMALVYVIVIRYVRKLHKKRITSENISDSKKLVGQVKLDRNLVSQMVGLLTFGIILSITLTLYLQTLIEYSTKNSEADHNLALASNQVQEALKNRDIFENLYENYNISVLKGLASLAVVNPDLLENDVLADIVDDMALMNLMVFDEEGYCVSSGSGYTGFLINSFVTEPGILQDLYSGTKTSAYWNNDSNDYFAIMRKDEKGILCIQTYAGDQPDEDQTIETALVNTNFNQADKIYVKLDAPDVVYLIEDNSDYAQKIPVTLEESVMSGNYTGQLRLNGKWYYVNELKTEKMLYISGMAEIVKWIWKILGLFIELFGYGLLALILIVLMAFYMEHKPVVAKKEDSQAAATAKEVPQPARKKRSEAFKAVLAHRPPKDLSSLLPRDHLSDQVFRKAINRMLVFTLVIFGIFIFIEMNYYSSTVFRYLFSSKWERKFNLFSVTMIMLFGLAARLLSFLACKAILLIARNVGSRGVTIGHMLCSILNFTALFTWFFYTLVELGLKLSYLLTGAGVLGVVIGYACQQVINDLLSGLFLVFEGNFQVGDWISVGDWHGVVTEIGIRTTKIARGDDVRIYNNSSLNTVTVLSPSMAGALCLVSVDYSTDLEYVINLILNNQENYRNSIPHITNGPGVHGVTQLGDSGITIRIWASVDDQSNVAAVERSILKETKRLFDENGIVIPFPQVVLHQGK